jgi:ribonuclease P protein component
MSTSLHTLTQRSDFIRLRRGRKQVTPYFVLRMLPHDLTPPENSVVRVGYTVTTKCGSAVVRNRIKRRLRALVRELFPMSALPGHDYVLIALDRAQPSAAVVPYAELRKVLINALQRIHT